MTPGVQQKVPQGVGFQINQDSRVYFLRFCMLVDVHARGGTAEL